MSENQSARNILNKNYKQIMSAFSSIYTQLEFGDTKNEERLPMIAAYYSVVFFKAKIIPPITVAIDLFLKENPDVFLSEEDLNLAAEIITENHIHELKTNGLITVKQTPSGLYEIFLTDKGKVKSRESGIDIRLI